MSIVEPDTNAAQSKNKPASALQSHEKGKRAQDASSASSPAPGLEIVLIGSAGVWAKGPTLDEAFASAKKLGGLGKQVVVVVSPVSVQAWVNEFGTLCWTNKGDRPRYALNAGKLAWPNRRTPALRAAVAATIIASE